VIASVTQAFCRTATAPGSQLRASSTPACLPSKGHDLRSLLRSGATDEEISQFIERVWNNGLTVIPSCVLKTL
jgi:GTP 3',8-cyclase